MLKIIRITILIASAAIALTATVAMAAGVGRVATIDIPGNKLDNFDIGYVDSDASRYYIADRSNAAIDIFDTQKKTFIGRVGGFVGVKMDNGRAVNNMSGPNGVAFAAAKRQLWVGGGDS